ncbi:MAG: PEP-CTERM sorting domain-containing protein [Candidatus Omnitrophica bacterium]|nr:PEP-CTERM sorting domain-containing protein [Candidatus Omnitrophota bacterium]
MKKFMQAIFMGVAVVGTASFVIAAPLTLVDVTTFGATGTNAPEDLIAYGGTSVNYLSGWGDFVAWQHQFQFIPAAEQVLGGSLTVTLRDDERDTLRPSTWEFAFGYAEDGTWALGEVDSAQYSYNVNAQLLADGRFAVKIVSLGGDFFIDKSELHVTYNPVDSSTGSPVPEPASMLLLGPALLGLLGLKRKK